jgi:hypothetical protein
MNRPLTILGAERRLFFVALIAGGAIFSLMHLNASAKIDHVAPRKRGDVAE